MTARPGCPDPMYCQLNRVCYWQCLNEDEEIERPAAPRKAAISCGTCAAPVPIIPYPLKPYTGWPGVTIKGGTIMDWLMSDGSIVALTPDDVASQMRARHADRPKSSR